MDLSTLQTTSSPVWRMARLASLGCLLTAGLILSASQAGAAWTEAGLFIAGLR